MVDLSPEMTKSDALKLEYRIKRTSADKKIDELEKIGLQISISRGLRALAGEIRALGKKVERIAKVVGKFEIQKAVDNHRKIHQNKNHNVFRIL